MTGRGLFVMDRRRHLAARALRPIRLWSPAAGITKR
jgi:hypothetical protein